MYLNDTITVLPVAAQRGKSREASNRLRTKENPSTLQIAAASRTSDGLIKHFMHHSRMFHVNAAFSLVH
jgi:hypothetical protein